MDILDPEGTLRQSLVEEDRIAPGSEDPKSNVVYDKIAWKVLPVLIMVALVCYLDRTNISLAAAGMSKDIGITKAEYGIAASVFFVPYIIFQIPSNMALKKVGTPLWLGSIMIGWGITASLTAFVRNAHELYAMRMMLGVFEAGTFPGTLYYLSLFFPERRMSLLASMSYSGALIGLCISAPLAGGLLSMDGILGLRGWQWLLCTEGLPSILVGLIVMFYLPKSPRSAKFLNVEEQGLVEDETYFASHETTGFLHQMADILLNVRLWLYIAAMNMHGIARYAAQFWTPLWIDAMASGQGLELKKGASVGQKQTDEGILAAFLTTIPYVFAAVMTVFIGWSSVKFQDRKYHVGLLSIFVGMVFVLLPQVNGWGLTTGVIALTLINIGVAGVVGIQASLALSCMASESRALGTAWFVAVGNLCGLIGPLAVGLVVDWTGSYIASLYFSGICLFLAAGMYLVMKDNIHMY